MSFGILKKNDTAKGGHNMYRGQMTILLRQAGLPVPGVMGPTKEETAAYK